MLKLPVPTHEVVHVAELLKTAQCSEMARDAGILLWNTLWTLDLTELDGSMIDAWF